MKKLMLFLSLSCGLLIISNLGIDDAAKQRAILATTAEEDTTDAFAAFEAAFGNYTDLPSNENFETYKSRAQQYLNVLKSIQGCSGVGDTQEWQENIREVEAEVALIYHWKELP